MARINAGILLGLAIGLSGCVSNETNGLGAFGDFSVLDSDRNRFISADEWRRVVEVDAIRLPQVDADGFRCWATRPFQLADGDRDGRLSKAEWRLVKFEMQKEVICPNGN